MKKKIGLGVLLGFVLVSCSHSGINNEDVLLQNHNKTIAAQYVENLILRGKVAEGKKLKSKEYPDFIKAAVYGKKDFEGKEVTELSDIQLAMAVGEWKSEETERIAKRFDEYPEIAEMTEAENEIERRTLAELPEEYTADDYVRLRTEKVSEYLEEKNGKDKSMLGKDVITKDVISDINSSHLSTYKANYKKGRILINVESSGSSSGSSSPGLGHAALMSEDSWNSSWDNDKMAKTSIGAWGCASSSGYWTGATSTVQYEPLAYWTGSSGLCPEVTVILDVAGASETEYSVAAEMARKRIGADYQLTAKYNLSNFYCSKLVWYCWYSVNPFCVWGDRDWVLPYDILNADNTTPVAIYRNK